MEETTKCELVLHINGEQRTVITRQAETLLFVLRDELGLTGTKPGCLNGDCGACTVLVNGTPIKSCMMLAIETVGKEITTIEGLRDTPIQHAFVRHFAFQCGYCTPGFIMNIHALIEQHPNADQSTIQEWLQSNICRCTSYQEIEAAVKEALQAKKTDIQPSHNRISRV
ncbi:MULTISPECIES: (2Fe-2S)-binding protein [Geobacillus]|jgi:aerobic carbon-monoxide dehydrogenase small subunit|uniref:Xanthine dehydrogenase iron-sulfur subunit n=2 Tax=Geobacillus thermodenitrificans TaxID=33940 RepID=A4IK81_GEOTN|nr:MULTISPECIES: (2Fe-2S)-binding protein [Geobacillus]ABO65735.1 Xanthine dehydrogenase iron-sulfur subunit [Geobacillus thermodenitrificans NG80-2]ARA97814.1 (2Fe-2S)-binding protein [Geobacillus thermodenitrificans]ARP41427.1 Nicotinate dehydrogenase small FeS subunit [Geobacillus thermodenitrificans]ATO37159.1 (2Fe-2S)-binding protein [Geobacillus thermodenitrificans]MEC5189196.1 carbon-monoxide dehydrogenase small subunit [Geobacillus thermodenitrificans]